MDLISLIPDGNALLAMEPEDLAPAVLRTLNSNRGHSDPERRENISITNYCAGQAQRYQTVSQNQVAWAIGAAFQHLINTGMLTPNPFSHPFGWYVLTTRARALRTEADYAGYRHASRYPRGSIHPLIEQNTCAEFMKGDYDTAVFKAFLTLEDLVRKRARLGDEQIGVPMMRKAFHAHTGPLTDKTEHEGEREALMHLMAGVMGRFKNPTSHKFPGLKDPATAVEILQLASLLVRVAESREPSDPDSETPATTPAGR